ncbi:hypothetical protein [Enterococcus timonensis]|uniref:hypothetical protein n=1 Tax=Enterococcus timonensis TaxID=1852364 RepID=UPI0009F2536A|nr:hypothetical protein [Enterococcus timonensis]
MTKQIAATIILNQNGGAKKFLMRLTEEPLHFVVSDVKDGLTGLASILETLKALAIPVDQLNLVELTNVQMEQQQLPFFVFSLENEIPLADTDFAWRPAEEFRRALIGLTLEGAPLF